MSNHHARDANEAEVIGSFLLTFGSRVKALRTRRRMSQRELSIAIGQKTPIYICNVERGQISPSLMMIIRIADALRVRPIDLFWEG